jgi:hypothetical protein
MTIKPASEGHALTLGRYWINRNPLDELKHLRAQVGWWGGKSVIVLTDRDIERIDQCIAFNEGREYNPSKHEQKGEGR